jgi:S-adenosylmethionine-diacylgycerolhomoserine-N-methlytransferase
MNQPGPEQNLRREALASYYRLHARVYDATRWSFLFGRGALVRALAARRPGRVLEVGCGTGRNLQELARRCPGAELTGVDLSPEMLARARRRLGSAPPGQTRLVGVPYADPFAQPGAPFDAVLFAYSLSMMNPGWQQALEAAAADLRPGGLVAVVDFHDTRSPAFSRWMALNHVRMDGHLLPALEQRFAPLERAVRPAYFGLWRYVHFLGRRA